VEHLPLYENLPLCENSDRIGTDRIGTDEIGGAKSYCAHCANYRDNRQMMFNRAFACIVIRDKQVGASPIEPAHVRKEECAYEPEKKNKNNDCKDFIQYGSCK